MKMKRARLLTVALLALALCLFCTACSTSAFENADTYYSEVGSVLKTWFSSSSSSSGNSGVGGSTQDDSAKLDAPGSFTLDADGNYSFTGVENADYYLLYFCDADATGDSDPFLFSSNSIPAEGEGGEIYSGNVNDLISYGYGQYLVKVFAFPNLNDSEHSMSTAATASFSSSGAQDAPVVDYLWNTFEGTIDIQISNIDDYTYQAYPDLVEVTFTNVESGAAVVLSIETLSLDNYSLTSDALTPGATYDITAVGYSESDYVTNQTSDTTDVAQGVTFGGHNVISLNYYYTDGIARSSFSYPQVTESLDLAAGGTLNSDNSSISFTFTATPTAANAGSTYSFIVAADCRFSFDDATLELYNDGTFLLSQYGEMPPEGPSTIQGIWTDNEDGTVTLSYNHATLTTSVG